MRLGAHDYVNKPFKSREIEVVVQMALSAGAQKNEPHTVEGEALRPSSLSALVIEDPAMRKVAAMIRKVAENPDVTVLIEGESGTGKEVAARAIHVESARRDRPFVAINCAAIPSHLLESELFGHERGAFTDAKAKKIGLMEQAQGGTLLLDEIGDMDIGLQAKLLRILEERSLRRVGGLEEIPLDVRIVAATNRALEDSLKVGTFREDLYYRIKLISIRLPALRERKADILPLARYFLDEASKRYKRPMEGISREAEGYLLDYPWPGNVRELKNTMERILILEDTDRVSPEHLPPEILRRSADDEGAVRMPQGPDILRGVSFDAVLDDVARHLIRESIRLAGGNKAQAARYLGMDRGTLRYQIKRLEIELEDGED
jgi:DNA-binding NtrC family response regulator